MRHRALHRRLAAVEERLRPTPSVGAEIVAILRASRDSPPRPLRTREELERDLAAGGVRALIACRLIHASRYQGGPDVELEVARAAHLAGAKV